ncbi:MAG: hypothetical protein H8Z69_02065 [Nanohaloarchaea archaeon]|nr:hypothetical protein [Candidatus Nanohaloarchaea archaeon]
MKDIKKIGKIGASLLVGVTLTASAAANLDDYPQPFVDDQGMVDSTIVVGENAKTADVVGAINMAGSLSQQATTTEKVSGAAQSWSMSQGATLDTSNDNLFFHDMISSVRQTLTENDLSALQTTTGLSGDAEQDIEQYLYVGDQKIEFGKTDDEEDPEVYVNNPSTVEADTPGSYLYQLQANFQEGVDFYDSSETTNKNTDVYGEELEMFGKTFTVSQDSFTSSNSGQLVLYGSSQDVQISSGESATITIDGEDHTISVQAVNTEGVVYSVDGESAEQDNVDETFDIGDTEVRIDSKINLKDDTGSATFSVGSEKLILEDDSSVMTGDDEEEVEGTDVKLELSDDGSDGDVTDGDGSIELSSVKVAVGAADSDENYVSSEQKFEDPVFGSLSFSFEGLSSLNEGEDIEVQAQNDETVEVSTNEITQGFAHYDGSFSLADDDGDKIVAVEGEPVQEDEYFTSDAGDFSHFWEVTGLDADAQDPSSGDTATVELEDKISGSSIEVELDANDVESGAGDSTREYEAEKVIDGQTYHFSYNTVSSGDENDDEVEVTWGTDSDYSATGSASSGATTAFPTIKTDNGARLAFYDPGQDPSGISIGASLTGFSSDEKFFDVAIQTNEGTNGFGSGDDIVRDIGGSGTYSDSADTNVAGTNPSDGTSLTTSNPWSGATNPIAFVDDSDSTWESGSDLIIEDLNNGGTVSLEADTTVSRGSDTTVDVTAGTSLNDLDETTYLAVDNGNNGFDAGTDDDIVTDDDEDGVYTSSADVLADANGASGTSFGGGTPASISTGDSLTAFDDTDNVYLIDTNNDGLQASGNDDVLFVDGDGDGDSTTGTVNTIINQSVDSTFTGSQLTSSNPISFNDQDSDGTTGNGEYELGQDIYVEENTAGARTYSASADTVVNDEGSADRDAGDSLVSVGSNAYYHDADSGGTYTSGDEIYLDLDSDSQYTAQADNHIAGITLSTAGAGTSVNTGNPWSAANPPVAFYDDGSGSWESGNDVIVTDDDGDNVYTSQADTLIDDTDGTQDVTNGDPLTGFAAATKYEDANSNTQFDSSEVVVDDSDTDGTYDSGETILANGGSSGNIQYWSTDSSETSGVTGLNSILPSKPGLVVIEEETENGDQHSYTVTPGYDGGDSEVTVNQPSYSSSNRQTATLESNDDITAGVDRYGVYTEHDSDGQGSLTLNYPDSQATAGAGFGTGELSSTGSSSVQRPAGWPNAATLDTQASQDQNMILVGGPAVNTLTETLAENNQTKSSSEYQEDMWMLQTVENAFNQNQALVVAGHSAEDTQAASNYLANYQDHQDEMTGKSLEKTTVSTQ